MRKIQSAVVTSRSSASSSYNSLTFRLPYPSISACVLLLFSFSALLFIFSQRQISKVDHKHFFSEAPPTMTEYHLWNSSSGYGYYPCVKPTHKYQAPQAWERYLTVRCNGGLNQMRTGISDMVAVARMMNATLVIPQLDKRSFWQDSSIFADIFDEPYFIQSLQGDVRILQQLPKDLESAPRARKHFTSWAGAGYYDDMAHLWKEYRGTCQICTFHNMWWLCGFEKLPKLLLAAAFTPHLQSFPCNQGYPCAQV